MKIKLLLAIVSIFCLCNIVPAQTENADFQEKFNTWKSSVSKNAVDSQNQFFLMAETKRIDAKSATVKIGLFGVFQSYDIVVTPLKYEKNADGKFVKTKTFDEVKMSAKGSAKKTSNKPKFSDPTITFFADPEANAIEIEVKTNDGKNPRITLRLSQDQLNTATLMTK